MQHKELSKDEASRVASAGIKVIELLEDEFGDEHSHLAVEVINHLKLSVDNWKKTRGPENERMY